MKNEGALRMRFLRHVGIYRSDVSFVLFTPGACPAFRSGRCQGIGHTGKNMPCPSSAMSSGRLFLDQVARQHCLSPLRRQGHHKTLDQRIETNYHRTARCGLSGCLTLGVHPNAPRPGAYLRMPLLSIPPRSTSLTSKVAGEDLLGRVLGTTTNHIVNFFHLFNL